jgi:2-polyprenyl-3-methyl-5-hydroxy-6-metoxy-1,4-benzoquinol methylase
MTEQNNQRAFLNNRRTVQAYEGYARQYAAAVPQESSGLAREGIKRIAAIAPAGTILEVGSGPGWDADFAESLGLTVRRTDITQEFREFQKERGKAIEALDILTDDFGGPYDGIIALYVLQHIDREQIATVLRKVQQALKPKGVFLVSLREGDGELWEHSQISGDYHVVLWSEASFVAHLDIAGLKVLWTERNTDSDGDWLTLLAQNQQQA